MPLGHPWKPSPDSKEVFSLDGIWKTEELWRAMERRNLPGRATVQKSVSGLSRLALRVWSQAGETATFVFFEILHLHPNPLPAFSPLFRWCSYRAVQATACISPYSIRPLGFSINSFKISASRLLVHVTPNPLSLGLYVLDTVRSGPALRIQAGVSHSPMSRTVLDLQKWAYSCNESRGQ